MKRALIGTAMAAALAAGAFKASRPPPMIVPQTGVCFGGAHPVPCAK